MHLRKFLPVLFAVLAFAPGCSKPVSQGDAIAVVNGTPIGQEEFKKELSLRSLQDPSFKITPQALEDQLNLLVNRKLLIEEALDRKLAEDDRFKSSIKIFWEQTLIRLLMDHLSKEFEQSAFASEEEINSYYAKLGSKVSFEIKRSRDKAVIAKTMTAAKSGQAVDWDETTAPVTFADISSPVLEQAIGLKQGESGMYEKDGVFYLVRIASKETVAPPALDSIREQIKTKIKLRKQAGALEEWFKEKRKKADIKLNLNERSMNGLSSTAAQ